MVHAVGIHAGKVYYCNKFLETERLKEDMNQGKCVYHRFGELFGKGMLLSLLDRL